MEGARKLQGKQLINLSKALAKVLRHSAKEEGIEIRADGFCNLTDVLNVKYISRLNPSLADVQAVVEDNNKKRYELKKHEQFPDVWMIRAVQGHSITEVQDEELLQKISTDISEAENVFNYDAVCHGTYDEVLKIILETGMCRMTRNSMHFAPAIPGTQEVISGMRNSCQIVVEANLC
jgi:2'-phosphotransferase